MTSDMVASRSDRTGQPQIQSRFTTHDYPGTKEKIAPRAGTNSLWNKELKDIVSRCQLTHIIDEGVPPSWDFIRGKFSFSAANDYQITNAHQYAVREWQAQNTHLFWIIDASITLKGPYLEADLRLIELSFHKGDMRDGVGYLLWVRSFKQVESIVGQQALLTYVSAAKLSGTASLTQVTKHCSDLWIAWSKIAGNSTDLPDAFYHRLLGSIPDVPEHGKIARLRDWVAVKITDRDPILLTPSVFLDRITLCASALKIEDSSHQVNVVTNPGGKTERGAATDQRKRTNAIAATLSAAITRDALVGTHPSLNACAATPPFRSQEIFPGGRNPILFSAGSTRSRSQPLTCSR